MQQITEETIEAEVPTKYVRIECEHSAQVDPKLLKHHPKNPNEHPPEQIEFFKNILLYQGWRRPITVSKRSGFITKGHGALITALEMGLAVVPVDYQNYDSEDQELADILADNQLARMSTLNNDKLQKIIDSIDSDSVDLELTGFKLENIDEIMTGFDGWTPRQEPDLSIPQQQPEVHHNYAVESIPSGGPAEGQPYEASVSQPQGSKELPKEDFAEFRHKCPKCSFEFN